MLAVLVGLAGLILILWDWFLPVVAPAIFTLYLLYGFVRPFLPHATLLDIEEEDEEPEPPR